MTTTAESPAILDQMNALRIIDADSHITEPPDLWLSRVPQALKGRVPVQQTVDGRTAWYLDGELWASVGGNTIRVPGQKVLGSFVVHPFDRVDTAAWSVPDRLSLLDGEGIWGQILYPNGIGFASNHIFAIEDHAMRTAILQTYNDFFVDVQNESKGRLFPQALLPIWDMDLTIKEMTRLLDKGITGFTLSDRPEMLGLPELPEPYFEPMWDLFNSSGAVANFHIGAGARREETEAQRAAVLKKQVGNSVGGSGVPMPAMASWGSLGRQRSVSVLATQMYTSNLRIIVNLCMSNLFDRYPGLKIVSAESGIGWVPFVLEALEFQFDEMVTEDDELAFAQRRPSEYFRDHIYVMFWFEKVAARKLIEDIGVNNVMVETDIPHPTCLYPNARGHFARVLADLDPHIVRRVLQDNAAELYGISLP